MNEILIVNGLSFRYGNQTIFKDINLSLGRGKVLALLGPNGCGKTTLINCILNFLKADKGEVILNGKSISQMKVNEVAKIAAYVPQVHNKTFPYKVEEIVMMGRAAYTPVYSSPNKEDRERALEAMKTVGIYHLKDRPYIYLSGGESQLVMLARAITQETPLIVMDEPTSHLDCYNELLMLDRVIQLIKEKQITVLIATHFPNQVYHLMNNGLKVDVALMKKQKFMDYGSANQILTEKNITKLYGVKTIKLSAKDEQGKFIEQIVPIGIEENCLGN